MLSSVLDLKQNLEVAKHLVLDLFMILLTMLRNLNPDTDKSDMVSLRNLRAEENKGKKERIGRRKFVERKRPKLELLRSKILGHLLVGWGKKDYLFIGFSLLYIHIHVINYMKGIILEVCFHLVSFSNFPSFNVFSHQINHKIKGGFTEIETYHILKY